MSDTEKTKQSFSSLRRWVLGFNFALAALALLALVAMVNYLAGGYYKRLHLDSRNGVQLQRQTLNVLNSLTEDVSVTIFFNPDNEGELYGLTTSLLREYRNASKHIKVTLLNYAQSQGPAKDLLESHKLIGLKDKDFILFECKGRSKIVYSKNLAEYNLPSYLNGRERTLRRSEFHGELLFTSAIFTVTHPQPLKACFLQGHAEGKPDSTSGEESFSKLATMLEEEIGTKWETLSLAGTNAIPSDCQLLIVAGPRRNFLPSETEKIEFYLKQGGRMLLLLDNRISTDIEEVLSKFGARASIPPLSVRERNENFKLSSDGSDFMAANLRTHPTLNAIEKFSSLRFFAPRYFDVKINSTTPGAPDVTELARSSDEASNGAQKGAFTIAVAIEQGGIKGVNAPKGGTRIVALGDSLVLSDQVIDTGAANHTFANLALNWLLDRPEILLAGINSQPIKEYRLLLTQSQTRSLRLIFMAGMPGTILFVGWLVWLKRRR